ncbi:amidohydrolase [Tenericutes bacterium MO-XQ]|nr:amidohydrolase [Tenericutes bacterium MO-XQ]AUD63692.1 amidohydrolase [Tenericutes bacterium MO-XQ]
MIERLKKYRRDLHQIPEISFDLFKTSAYIKKELESMGYEIYQTAFTGWIAYKKGKKETSIAFRSDMDALPVLEKSDYPYPSTHIGKMHACGHDGHMAMLLGFAYYLKDQTLINDSIVLIFQPAEEYPGGAKVIIEEGFLEKFKVQKIFGIHLYPNLKEGVYGLVKGPMMARNLEFNIKISGKSAHGASPHDGNDAILASSHLISQLHTIISRNVDPFEQGVITVGTVHGGEARNIIAQDVEITGTMRAFKHEVFYLMKKRIEDVISGIKLSFQVEISSDLMELYPVVNNDADMVEFIEKHLDDNYEYIKPLMASEDFAFYQEKVPGMFTMLGTRNEEKGYVHPLHSCYFNFKDEVLARGVELYITIAKAYQLID